MSEMSIQQVLSQMRALQSDATGQPESTQGTAGTQFSELLSQSIEQVNNNQQQAAELSSAFEQGDPNADLTEVMIAMQKARVSFEAMTEVRNKLVEAYKEIQNMPI
ncbi:flagellar hook-basal body complex protein FliE [Wenzhouxiangella sp. AB-CW3]|uniref:flagellar hook-basal body complex protein FliE n=1 Tax=Wenzhouxiangella sp. AB-CW3 TaxID=2771012 RepID=UPI00168BB4A5|nr:flagellar hook-basal body complex protein FliE [Wenzhouxiangella sp. AB-CW3]QOC21205.1 flagellar hook-basal body complex protein FliE [Wenzhouxiangella sp. AB-CW3]